MNRNIKAFTLIELLAVIVILAIIALIATPIILGIINDAKAKAFRESLNNTFHAYELYVAKNLENKDFDFSKPIEIKDLPLNSNLSGTIFINDDEKIELKYVSDGSYCATGTKEDLNIIKGTCDDLVKNILTVKVNVNSASRSIVVTVDAKEGIPTSYSYQITDLDNKPIGKTITSNEPSHTFTKLTPNTDYKIIVTIKNKSGLTKEITKDVHTELIGNIELNLTNIVFAPNKEYIKSGSVLITYPEIEEGQVNQYKWCTQAEIDSDECENKDFTNVEKDSISIPAQNGILIAIVKEAEGSTEPLKTNVLSINNIDGEAPKITDVDVNGFMATIIVSDTLSELHAIPYSCNGGITWQLSNICSFTSAGTYTIKVRDKAQNEATKKVGIASPPVLGSLTPVLYNGTNWVVVDTSNKWYDYTNQNWANAVLLKSGVTKSVGDTVTVEGDNPDATAMFVWIPRYEYKIDGQYGIHIDGTAGTKELPGEIEVQFISKSKTTATSGYRVHSAFTFGEEELDGIWVGKFETTGTATSPTILPNVASLRSQNISTQFVTAQKFNNYITGYDSHVSKNSEWGATAYLSQSTYGKYGNTSYTGAEKQVRINNCSNKITGIGANSQDEASSTDTCTISTNGYTTENGQAASTTGNITGIYDMSGGTYEYVMGVYAETPGLSGFTDTIFPETKYYDNYTTTTAATACNNGICYGHALSETAGWYSDQAGFVYSSYPWFIRGGRYDSGSNAGVLSYRNSNANYYGDTSFRVVLSKTNLPRFSANDDFGKVTIAVTDIGSGLHATPYSCDGKWQASNVCNFTTSGNHTIAVRNKEVEIRSTSITTLEETEPSAPVLGNLTPVVYNGTNWVVADTSTKWYDYANQEWANAVLLKSGTKNVGATVNISTEVKAMFVWIPRYEYKIEGIYAPKNLTRDYGTHSDGTVGTQDLPGDIKIKFIPKSKITADTEYIIHPAFTFGTQELDGIWMGKFETGHTTLSSPTTDNSLKCSTESCANAAGLIILPNVKPLRSNNVSNMFYAARSMSSKLGITGFDSHMAKNSEWGAAAYLSQSKYGKYGNTNYEGAEKQVRINNCYSGSGSSLVLKTGVGANLQNEAVSKTTCNTNTYETEKGQAASTTGNITGIYDMSGGSWEYVMGVYGTTKGSSGLTVTSIDKKYYDSYGTETSTTACNNGICYGHALSETSGWYGDAASSVTSRDPWLERGGSYSKASLSGVFHFDTLYVIDTGDAAAGGALSDTSFRVVLAQAT